jgi:pilus assembly protein CpaE
LLRSIIICPDADLAAHLETALTAVGGISAFLTLDHYPTATELVRTLRAHAPDIIFLSIESLEKSQETVGLLEKEARGVQIIAVHRRLDASVLRETMRLGVREFLTAPIERQALLESLRHAALLLERHPPDYETTSQIFSFLPSKAGVGTSTLALNVSAALSRRSEKRVLLSDFDLNSGMMRFLLKIQNEFSVTDAVERSNAMDEQLWPQLVTSVGNLDVLHAGHINPSLRIEPTQIRNLVQFMRRNYQTLCFDLSGNLERYSVELMQESKRVLLVCTPEIPSLHLAREKLHFLRAARLEGQIYVILSRVHKRPLFTKEQVEELLGVPVLATVPNDYLGVNRATSVGTFVDVRSDLGKNYERCATALLEACATPVSENRKKFLEFFSVPASSQALQR